MKYDPLNEKTTVIVGDALEKLRTLESGSVHCCVTSPPYFGLRDYGTATWEGGGDDGCDHIAPARGGTGKETLGGGTDNQGANRSVQFAGICGKCGARRIDSQIGLEPTPDEYVAKMVEIFREVRRVLRDDGTLWLNLGDSYSTHAAGKIANPMAKSTLAGVKNQEVANESSRASGKYLKCPELPEKNLIGIPWRVAFALQADGWYLRQDIIWHKPNPMPESVKDRCTKAHEYVFMFSKSARYFYDAEAVAEPANPDHFGRYKYAFWAEGTKESIGGGRVNGASNTGGAKEHSETRNRRSVWTIATQPYAEAHFATMAPQLAETCIKAGSPAEGIILDPFGGAGTTALCATLLGRSAILIELNPEYEKLIRKRLKIGKTEIAAPIQDAGIFEGLL